MPTWTDPRTWLAGEMVDEIDLNAHLRDNLLVLKSPAMGGPYRAVNIDYINTSTSWADVDGTNLNWTLTTAGGRLLVCAYLQSYHTDTAGLLDVLVDGVSITSGIGFGYGGVGTFENMILFWTDALSAGSHAVKLRFKKQGGTQTKINSLWQAWVREVS